MTGLDAAFPELCCRRFDELCNIMAFRESRRPDLVVRETAQLFCRHIEQSQQLGIRLQWRVHAQ